MYVSEYIEFLVNGEIQQLAITDVGDMDPNAAVAPTETQLKNQDKLRTYINLANIELHKKFDIIQKEMELDNAIAGEEYRLPDDFLHAINVTYTDGDEVAINNTKKHIVDGVDQLVSVLLTDPSKAIVKGTDSEGRVSMLLTYAASPALAKSVNIKLYLSPTYTEALLNYAAYKAHASVSGDMKAENNTYYLRFRESCKQIQLLGLTNPDNLDSNTKLVDNGFV